MNNFGYNLRYLRKAYKLNQEEMGRIVGKTYAAVSHWELGEREPSEAILRKYRDYFGVDPADLMFRRLDEQSTVEVTSDVRKLFKLIDKMDEQQFARLLAYAEGLVHASL